MQQTYSKTKSKLPIPITRRKTATNEAVTLSKLENENNNKQKRRKSTLFSSTCSRRAQEDKNYNKRLPTNNDHSFSFSIMHHTKKPAIGPTILLKENIEQLRNKNIQDRLVIKTQEEEIKKLKRLVTTNFANKQENIQLELSKKSKMQDKMKIMTLQIEELKIQVINSLKVKEKTEPFEPYSQQIQVLKIELEAIKANKV
ncbi:hypothetical protein CU098_012770 [Rhizopus stolonifer]|uniref:Lebercilin domain-containing protein n=1 Tax=Rhizopus stolonifer TaxID=4846 RepID=A0A367KUD5_RHIST|nr:hypothetical protein CU098_012770 [Rhizopus stolonifer]